MMIYFFSNLNFYFCPFFTFHGKKKLDVLFILSVFPFYIIKVFQLYREREETFPTQKNQLNFATFCNAELYLTVKVDNESTHENANWIFI